MNQTLLAFEDVCFRYLPENGNVLDGFSLSIEPRTVTAILGPNGVGKTTLLHLALGWRKPQSGRVLLDGRPLSTFSHSEIGRQIGLVPQGEHIPYEYSLLEYVLLGRAPYLRPLEMPGEADCVVAADALETVGLSDKRARPVTNLSGGEQQLVLVARALAQQPKMLLLDEPTAHLDLSNKIRLLDLLQDLTFKGVTIVFSTHDPEVAASIATHLVLMRAGKILRAGPMVEEFTTEKLSEAYGIPVEVRELEGRRIVLWKKGGLGDLSNV